MLHAPELALPTDQCCVAAVDDACNVCGLLSHQWLWYRPVGEAGVPSADRCGRRRIIHAAPFQLDQINVEREVGSGGIFFWR